MGDMRQSKELTRDNMEVGLYLKSGFQWKDVEVKLDLMEKGASNSCPGPLLRLGNAGLSKTMDWWFEYYINNGRRCTMRPLFNNNDGNWKYNTNLPTAFKLNMWFHFKYRVMGGRLSQWVNGKLVHDNI